MSWKVEPLTTSASVVAAAAGPPGGLNDNEWETVCFLATAPDLVSLQTSYVRTARNWSVILLN